MTGGQPLAVCDNVSRVYGTGSTAVVAVHGTSCLVPAGARIALIGASGSGKSTLLHLLAGLEHPTAGAVTWPGLDGGATKRASGIGVVFQGLSLVPALDVLENTALPVILAGEPDPEGRAWDALRAVGIADLAGKLPEELSGGQAQRVAVARVLAQQPRLVLADEPTGQLDQATGHHVLDVLLDAVGRLGAGLVVTTHDQAVADRLDTHWFMNQGRLHTSDTERVLT